MTSSTTQSRRLLGRITALAALLVLMMAAAASAATYTVTDTNDDNPVDPSDCTPNAVSGDCSLREAIAQANASPEGDRINVPAGEYGLTNDSDPVDGDADLDVLAQTGPNSGSAGSLTIVGNSARDTIISSTALSGDDYVYSRIFDLEGGTQYDSDPVTGGLQCADAPGTNVELRNLTITRGFNSGDGGGINVQDANTSNCAGFQDPAFDARLLVVDSAVTRNSTSSEGGGIWNGGEVTLVRSLIAGNFARDDSGGGIWNEDTVSLTNVTVGGNVAGEDGGAIGQRADSIEEDDSGGDEVSAAASLVNVTVANNEAGQRGGAFAREAFDSPPSFVYLRNTIIAGNVANRSGQSCHGAEPTVSRGFNLEDDDTCLLSGPGDKSNTDAALGTRGNNGGPTDTYALLPVSPAIDAGTGEECPAEDQRGVARPIGAACDIGAFEAPTPPPPAGPVVIREEVLVPTPFTRVSPRGLTLNVRKTRPTRRSLRLRSTGRVQLPSGLTAAQACTFGFVAVQVKANGKTVSTRIVQIRRDCRYTSQVTFNAMSRIRGRRLTVRARFFGNDRLRTRFSARRSAGIA